MNVHRLPNGAPLRPVVDADGDPLSMREPVIPQPRPSAKVGCPAVLQVVALVFAVVMLFGVLFQFIQRPPHVQTSAQAVSCEVRK